MSLFFISHSPIYISNLICSVFIVSLVSKNSSHLLSVMEASCFYHGYLCKLKKKPINIQVYRQSLFHTDTCTHMHTPACVSLTHLCTCVSHTQTHVHSYPPPPHTHTLSDIPCQFVVYHQFGWVVVALPAAVPLDIQQFIGICWCLCMRILIEKYWQWHLIQSAQ